MFDHPQGEQQKKKKMIFGPKRKKSHFCIFGRRAAPAAGAERLPQRAALPAAGAQRLLRAPKARALRAERRRREDVDHPKKKKESFLHIQQAHSACRWRAAFPAGA